MFLTCILLPCGVRSLNADSIKVQLSVTDVNGVYHCHQSTLCGHRCSGVDIFFSFEVRPNISSNELLERGSSMLTDKEKSRFHCKEKDLFF